MGGEYEQHSIHIFMFIDMNIISNPLFNKVKIYTHKI